ncbi:unnamed protein product [Blepharisma stoltei]|uniref:GYF domain-containing protein n=1 Tax=Blepharisma stoltei TaxID=1481888 RepID=A0AAU9IQV6_9CILI|nr:unnamed protein product [Blepharisma stoltei]
MSDAQRPRKLNPNYKQESNWRHKKHTNNAFHKYTREAILNAYYECPFPAVPLTEAVLPLYSSPPLHPFIEMHPNYREELGDEINSRKPAPREKQVEQVPEWYTESGTKDVPSPDKSPTEQNTAEAKPEKPENGAIDINDVQDEFGKIDLVVEEKLKTQVEEDEAFPEWDEVDDPEAKDIEEPFEKPSKSNKETQPQSKQEEALLQSQINQQASQPSQSIQPQQASKLIPFYDASLLTYQCSIKNPFAVTLAECAMLGSDNLAYFMPFSKPFEKFWFYKDLAKKVQGPFCTIEMFNWSVRGCFPPDLEIAKENTENFVPMNNFFLQLASTPQPKSNEQAKEAEIKVKESEPKAAEKSQQPETKFGNTYNEMFPAFEPSKHEVSNNKSKRNEDNAWEEVKKNKPSTKSTRGKAK